MITGIICLVNDLWIIFIVFIINTYNLVYLYVVLFCYHDNTVSRLQFKYSIIHIFSFVFHLTSQRPQVIKLHIMSNNNNERLGNIGIV